MDAYEETQRKTQEMIERMMGTYMSYGDIGRLTERVVEEIIEPEITGRIFDPMQFNIAHRAEDTGKNAWNTFNRIQTNLMEGGVERVISKADDAGVLFDVVSKTHKVTDSTKQIDFNKRLHNIIMETI